MGDKTEQPGPSEARVIEPIEDDVEGHRRTGAKLTDEPGPSEQKKHTSVTGSDEDDVEGHRFAAKK